MIFIAPRAFGRQETCCDYLCSLDRSDVSSSGEGTEHHKITKYYIDSWKHISGFPVAAFQLLGREEDRDPRPCGVEGWGSGLTEQGIRRRDLSAGDPTCTKRSRMCDLGMDRHGRAELQTFGPSDSISDASSWWLSVDRPGVAGNPKY